MYNAKNAEEAKGFTGELPKDTILTGIITKIEDGVVKEFISEEVAKNWQGDINSPGIRLTIEINIGEKEKEIVSIQQMYTYINEDGMTKYTPKSNLGKFKLKYGKLPELGDQVKVITNENGYGKVKIE